MSTNPTRIFFATLALVVVHLAWSAEQVPDVVASHFGNSGQVNGTSSRTAFIALNAVVLAMLTVTFGGLGLLMRRLPDSAINIPHKTHWLAPARRERTLAWLSGRLLTLGAGTLFFMAANTHLIVIANRVDPPRLPGLFVPLLVVYLLGVAVWLVGLFRALRVPSTDTGA